MTAIWQFLLGINLLLYPALFSTFIEKPGLKSGLSGNVWGNFPTMFVEGSTDLQFLPMFTFHPVVRGGWIMPSKMYLGSTSTNLTIGGYIVGFNADIGFRPINDKNYFAELRVGFVMNKGTKLFFDYTEDNVIKNAGASGYYDFLMFGPEFTLEGRWTFIPSVGLGIQASAFYSPSYENHSTVMNKDGTKSEFAPGYRYGGKALVTWNNQNILMSLGYKYERIYFSSGDLAAYDLEVIYSGPVAQVTFLF